MQQIDSKYALSMHKQGLRPYSQSIYFIDNKNMWSIRTLTKEAYEQIIEPLLRSEFVDFYLEHDSKKVKIIKKEVSYFQKSELFTNFYTNKANHIYTITFQTPTTFKKEGKYHYFPNIESIYSSLMRRYDATSDSEEMMNLETLEQLVSNTQIIEYKLHSVQYHLEGIKIPAFMGSIVLKINGPQTMVNFANLLFQFGNFSGVGIKTAIGMGKIKTIEGRGEKRNDRTRG
ncbi:MAG: CRISPR-associated endoribonuclease Cas6 [Clostridium sp.]|nr:CRISPR-associated endoribonuclease Cas6 [Clostridium sp.]